MRTLGTLLKIIIGLVIAIPVGLLALALVAGFLGSLVGLAVFALRLAVFAFVGYGLYRVARAVFAPSAKKTDVRPVLELPRSDPYYDAAMRELDAEFERPARS